jgi:hypothetical protein
VALDHDVEHIVNLGAQRGELLANLRLCCNDLLLKPRLSGAGLCILLMSSASHLDHPVQIAESVTECVSL